jgi:hypothetical protein
VSVRVNDLSAAFKAAIYAHLAGNLEDAAAFYRDEVKATIGIQGPPRSVPGQPPHRDTGDLQKSIDDHVDAANLVAHIGSDVSYAPILEVLMDRAFFVPTLIQHSDEIARRICRP